jgi:hypothetical protein
MAKMMFHARERTQGERAALGQRRVASHKAVSGLSVYARHPSEIPPERLAQEVDARRYMDHISQALKILLADTRPDLWEDMARAFRLAQPVVDVTQGKARQTTLAAFIKRG